MTVFINNIAIEYASEEMLTSWKKEGLTITRRGDDVHIEFKLPKKISLDNEFNLNMTQSPTGKLKAKAEVELNRTFKTSIDQDGTVEAGLNLKF